MLSHILPAVSPSHLLPLAKYTIADSYGCPLKSHGLEQWHKDPEWKSGTEVGGVNFGWQLAQREYYLRRAYITVRFDSSDIKVMVYAQTMGLTAVQFAWSMTTWGWATTKQMQLIFMFNTELDAEDVQSM